jgi:glyoxylase-like metal-dependent hydrolase (beta-lactamase superfamily II)
MINARTFAGITSALLTISAGILLFGLTRPSDAVAERPAPALGRFTVDGRPVTVHALPTGTVTVKRCHHTGVLPEGTHYVARFLAILADPRFAAPMPVWTYAVDHPDGIVLVDAGADPTWNDDATWTPDPVSGALVRGFIRLDATREEALPARLRAAGLDPARVIAVALTHQHVDHTGAVPAFPSADVWTSAAEDAFAERIGALPWRWRGPATRIRHVEAEGRASTTGLGAAVPLLPDGSMEAIHTPGHTPGSLTVRLQTDQGELLFTGDTSFTAAAMDPTAPTAGIHVDVTAVRALQARIREYVRDNPGTRLFPSHDLDVPRRLGPP